MAEKRLIDANLMRYKAFADPDSGEAIVYLQDIDEAPTVDAVEVVRCRDCRWSRTQDHREPTDTPKQFLICQCFMHHFIPAPWGARLAVYPDGFCSYGERRTDG